MASLSSSKSMVVEKPSQEPLKCPRCDSSNTKFCYYNNYSLSQPRHFCKACKRYWTRGGTLRNVPVGGGCRKNKRVKRQPPSHGGDVVSKAVEKASSGNPSFLQPRADLPHSSSIRANSLLYSLPNANGINPLEFRFPFSGLTTAKFSSDHHGFDLQHQVVGGLGIGFSSSTAGIVGNGEIQNNSVFKDLIQDIVFNNTSSSSSSSPLLNNSNNNNPMLFGSSSSAFSTSTSTSSMASLLASTIQQHNYANGDDLKDIETRNNFRGLMSYYEDISAQPSKLNGQNELSWDSNSNPNPNQYQISRINSSDPDSSLLWNPSNVSSAWFDPSNNMGSSVPSLI